MTNTNLRSEMMTEDRVKILGVAGVQGKRQEMEVPRMRTQQEIYDEAFKMNRMCDYGVHGVIKEALRQRNIVLKWVLNRTGLKNVVDPTNVKTLALTEKEVELMLTWLQ